MELQIQGKNLELDGRTRDYIARTPSGHYNGHGRAGKREFQVTGWKGRGPDHSRHRWDHALR